MKEKKSVVIISVLLLVVAVLSYGLYSLFGGKANVSHKVVLCIPVYGQSLALGEEAIRVTDFKNLKTDYDGRIVTENIDYRFGFFDQSTKKQCLKKIFHYYKRSFELSVYGMAEFMVSHLGPDTMVCVFPGGQGTTRIEHLGKGSRAYKRFVDDLRKAYSIVAEAGGSLIVPAVCWMQGESDIEEYPNTDYKKCLKQFSIDINRDVKQISHQSEDVRIICYQTNSLTRGANFDKNSYYCQETKVPQAFVELLRDDSLFWASGPTYPYRFAREAIHIDGTSQKRLGILEGRTALSIVRKKPRFKGLIPLSFNITDMDVIIHMNVPTPPLQLDTVWVAKVDHYGFKVVNANNQDILSNVLLNDDNVILECSESPIGCKVRYAVNGEYMKSGYLKGPRGNLHDSSEGSVMVQGVEYPLYNWCYQFDEELTSSLK